MLPHCPMALVWAGWRAEKPAISLWVFPAVWWIIVRCPEGEHRGGRELTFTERTIMKTDGSFCEKVSDGYVFTVSEQVAEKFRDSSDYGVTFVQLGADENVKGADLKKMLANPSNRSTVEGKATKSGGNRIKVVTAGTVT